MDEGESPLTLAARDADLEQLLLLLRERADPMHGPGDAG